MTDLAAIVARDTTDYERLGQGAFWHQSHIDRRALLSLLRKTQEALTDLGYYYGETYYYDPLMTTTCWLRSDGAGSSVPVSEDEQCLIDLLVALDPEPVR